MAEQKPALSYREDTFEYQAPTAKQIDAIKTVRAGCKELQALLLALPNCRERSLAITKLEEVSMWANKGIVFTPDEEFK